MSGSLKHLSLQKIGTSPVSSESSRQLSFHPRIRRSGLFRWIRRKKLKDRKHITQKRGRFNSWLRQRNKWTLIYFLTNFNFIKNQLYALQLLQLLQFSSKRCGSRNRWKTLSHKRKTKISKLRKFLIKMQFKSKDLHMIITKKSINLFKIITKSSFSRQISQIMDKYS